VLVLFDKLTCAIFPICLDLVGLFLVLVLSAKLPVLISKFDLVWLACFGFNSPSTKKIISDHLKCNKNSSYPEVTGLHIHTVGGKSFARPC
jgi:hypothetical protein